MWKSILLNPNQIECQTLKASLIKCPKNSKYKNYKFWFSNKLISNCHNFIRLTYSENFVFTFKSKTNEIKIDTDEFEEIFKVDESYLIVNEPEKINIDVVIPECLKNNN